MRQLSSATYDRYIQLQKGKRSLLRPLKLAYNGTLGPRATLTLTLTVGLLLGQLETEGI